MQMKNVLLLASIITFAITCKSALDLSTPKARQVKMSDVQGYHAPINLKVAWLPYRDMALKQTGENDWVIINDSTSKIGAIPMILVTYPESGDSVWIDMNTRSEELGKLIKHSLMTQQTIQEPYHNYLKVTKCGTCHPKDVVVDFER